MKVRAAGRKGFEGQGGSSAFSPNASWVCVQLLKARVARHSLLPVKIPLELRLSARFAY